MCRKQDVACWKDLGDDKDDGYFTQAAWRVEVHGTDVKKHIRYQYGAVFYVVSLLCESTHGRQPYVAVQREILSS